MNTKFMLELSSSMFAESISRDDISKAELEHELFNFGLTMMMVIMSNMSGSDTHDELRRTINEVTQMADKLKKEVDSDITESVVKRAMNKASK